MQCNDNFINKPFIHSGIVMSIFIDISLLVYIHTQINGLASGLMTRFSYNWFKYWVNKLYEHAYTVTADSWTSEHVGANSEVLSGV